MLKQDDIVKLKGSYFRRFRQYPHAHLKGKLLKIVGVVADRTYKTDQNGRTVHTHNRVVDVICESSGERLHVSHSFLTFVRRRKEGKRPTLAQSAVREARRSPYALHNRPSFAERVAAYSQISIADKCRMVKRLMEKLDKPPQSD